MGVGKGTLLLYSALWAPYIYSCCQIKGFLANGGRLTGCCAERLKKLPINGKLPIVGAYLSMEDSMERGLA